MSAGRTLDELARLVGGEVVGEGGVELFRVAPIESAGPGDLTLLAHPRYRSQLPACRASAILVARSFPLEEAKRAGKNFLRVREPYVALARILALFQPPPRPAGRVSAEAWIEPSAVLEGEVTVFPHVYVGQRARVGRGTVLYPGVFLGDEVEVGEECVLYPNVTVRERCRLGKRVTLHPGVVIGADGFGYAGEGEERVKIPQVGNVEIHDDVEIGANSTIDRATLGSTVIGPGTKIDNLVHIAHNVTVGARTLIIAQAGIAGSTRIGDEVILAGQVGVLNHLEIGDRARVGPKSGVARSIPAGQWLSGALPAAPHKEWLRIASALPRLPRLLQAVRALERRVARRVTRRGEKSDARD